MNYALTIIFTFSEGKTKGLLIYDKKSKSEST